MNHFYSNLKLFLVALFALVGVGAWADSWVKTAPADLQTGDVVVIVDQTSAKALANDGGTSKAPVATGVELNSDQSELTGDIAENLQWVVTVEDDSYQFGVADSDDYLYCTNTNNGVRVGTNANNAFHFTDNGEGVDFLVNTGTSRYIGVYNNNDWRCYTSINNNIKGCVVAFYKKEGSGEVDTRVATTLELGEYTATGEVGQTIDLPAVTVKDADGNVIDGAAYDWSSSNEAVATIEDGKINLLAAGTTTIKALFFATDVYKESSKSFTLTVTAAPFTSLQALQEAVTSTSTPVTIKFADVVVTAVNGSQAYLADAAGYGILAYQKDHGLEAGQVLNGTITANLVLYRGQTEITNFSTEGLTITTTELVPTVKTIDAITAANQSTLVTLENVTYADGKLSDGTNEIVFYDNFKVNAEFEEDKAYNVTGIVILYNETLEIAPRTAEDIAEYVETTPVEAFTLNCARGYVAGNGTKIYGVADAADASVFALIPYEGETYLYDVTNKTFAVHTTNAMAGTAGNNLLESNVDFTNVVKGLTWGDTEIEAYPKYLEDSWTNWLNMDGRKNVYMSTWKDFEGGAGGNTYAITVVEEFDANEAIAILQSLAPVHFVVSDANGVVDEFDRIMRIGATVNSVPAEHQRGFCSYVVEEATVVAGENTVNVTVTYSLPFELSTSFEDAKWYYARIRDTKYLRADENAKDTNGRYLTSTTNEKSAVYKWAFFGNPYTNYYIANKGAGEGKFLYAGAYPSMQETDAPATTEAYLYEVITNGDGFTLRSLTGATQYVNDNSSSLGYWNTSAGRTDGGSKWNVEAVPETDIEATYNVVIDGQIVATTGVGAEVGAAVSVPSVINNDFVTLTPDKETLTADGEVVTFTATVGELPFELSESFETAKWYYLSLRNKWASYGDAVPYKLNTAAQDETPNGRWAFMGTPYGIKVINKAAGEGKFLDATADNPSFTENEQGWVLGKNSNGFTLHIASTTLYMNDNAGKGVLGYWNHANAAGDGGSAFKVEAVPYAITVVEGIENGTVQANQAEAAEGKTVTLTITPAEGYVLDELTVKAGDEDVVVEDNTFTMPAAAVTISASFKVDPTLQAKLVAEIEKAEALKTETRTEAVEALDAAIAAAEAVKDATDVETLTSAIAALQDAETAFLTANLPVAEGTYYVYNPLTERFLSRGNAWGTSAVVDPYGVAINVAVADLENGKYTLTGFDNNTTYGDDAWMFADAGGDRARTFAVAKVEGGFTLTNTTNNQPVYVFLNEAEPANLYRVAGNGTKDENYTDDAQTVWQFLTPAERDELIAAREAAEKSAAFAAAGFEEAASVEEGEATELTFATGSAWTQTVVRTQSNQPATNANGTEMWQATGNYTQTVADLAPGLYKLSIQGFYRNGSSDECVTRYATGYNTVLAYLDANGTKIQVKSWAADKGEGNDPNSMPEAKAKFDEGKYLSEGFAYVGEDGVLNLTVNNPAFIGNGWFIVGNVKYAPVSQDDALLVQAELLASDAEAVAVGKLIDAIDAYKAEKDEDALTAAIAQFVKDNADQEKDQTSKVATNGWKNFNGGAAGVCATQYAPAITTYDGRTAQLAEVFEGNGDRTGTIIYQDITGLENGTYKVGFYGNAFSTSARDGFECTMEDGANDVAYVFANDEKAYIVAHIATSTTENDFRQFDVEVTDGTIKLGMGKDIDKSTNWHTMQIYQLTWFTTAKAVYAQDKADMQAAIDAAKALAADENKTEGKDELNEAIAAAEAALESNKLNIAEFEAELAALNAAVADFKKANQYLFDGVAYVIDAESGKFMAAGHNYGTRGIVNEIGLDLTFASNEEDRTVTIDTRVSNGGNNHFLGSNLYMDAAAAAWALEYRGFGFYIGNGTQYINIDADDNLVMSDTPREWIIVTADGVKEQRMEELAEATAENGVDATWLLQNPNFNRNDQRVSAWTVSEDCTNKNLNGGNQTNNCAESYHSTFTISQTITDAPKGLYKLTAQGFYRQDDGEEEEAPAFFIGDQTAEVPVKTGSENSMANASESFAAGEYTIEPIEFVLTDEELTVGVKGTALHQWVIFDNFRLTYYGPVAEPATVLANIDELNHFEIEVDPDDPYAQPYADVVLTLTDAKVLYSAKVEDDWYGDIEYIILEDATGRILMNLAGSSVFAPGTILNGQLPLGVEVSYGMVAAGANDDTAAGLAALEVTEGTVEPLVITDDNVEEWAADPYLQYVEFTDATVSVAEGDYTDEITIDVPATGDQYSLYDMFAALGENLPAAGDIINVRGFLFDYYGMMTMFIPVSFEKVVSTIDGIVEQTVTNRQTGEQVGEITTTAQSITIVESGDNLVDITFVDGITLPIGMVLSEFTISGVTAEADANGVITYSYDGQVSIARGQMTINYDVTVIGQQASADAIPVLCVTMTQAVIDVIYFGADQAAIDAYKKAVGIAGINGDVEKATIYDLSGRKVEKVQRGGVYVINGKKVSVK